VPSEDDPANTTVRVRERKAAEDEITSVHGSTRLEAKKQRRREGRDAGRRRVPVISEAEFLARREAVDREMVVRRRGDLMQIAVLEDKILAEHYVARGSQTSLIGNIYLGRVQNVLPSMEAAFIDIGRGRNAVLYAGEVDWKAFSGEGKPRRIEEVLSSGQSVLVQVTKDPVGHKGARLTSQVSLAGRFLVYVPGGHTSGISRKLPDTERGRLKSLLKDIVPAEAGVIVRTAAEGATEEQLTHDVAALTARWDDVTRKATGQGPKLLYAEPDLMIKVIRDLYNEDFKGLTVQGDDAWQDVQAYVDQVAPDLGERLHRWDDERDVFAAYRIDEQIAKGTDRKVWLPSGGSLVIDRTEAMTVVDVNTGKFTGSGGNLEETVTKNNLEAAEEIVRQLRLRDIGGIIVIDFIDMVLEDNRDLVLRRLVECLGRDRTRHQVAEVTSLGLVQMTRKRIGTGLLEAFSETCTCCQGRGFHVLNEPVVPEPDVEDEGASRGRDSGRSRGGRSSGGRSRSDVGTETAQAVRTPALDPRLRPKPHPPEPTTESGAAAGTGQSGDARGSDASDADGAETAPIEMTPELASTETGSTETAALESAPAESASETGPTGTAPADPAPAVTALAPAETAPAETGPAGTAPAETPAKPKRARRSRAKAVADKPAVDSPAEPLSSEPSVDG
jgi:ribonuclease E